MEIKILSRYNNPSQQVIPFVIEYKTNGGCARPLFKRLFFNIPIAFNRISHNF